MQYFTTTQPIQKPQGFTLIEILVVVMIIGIVAGASTAYVSMGGPRKDMNDSLERFVVISEHVKELSILDGEPFGLLLEPRDWRENPLDQGWMYHWKKMTPQGWQNIENLDPVEFPKEMQLRLLVEDIPWEYKKAPEIKEPQIAFYPTGEVTPFEIEFTHEEIPGESQTVLVNLWGNVVWKEREEDEKMRKELQERYE